MYKYNHHILKVDTFGNNASELEASWNGTDAIVAYPTAA